MKYYDAIPLDPIKLDSSNTRLKKALYNLSRIYDFNLEEYKNARRTYERFINEYPNEEKVPEAMYGIYLICKNKAVDSLCADEYKNKLLNEYPKSLYAKLILNPNYLVENLLLGEKIKYLYRSAFDLYEKDRYLEAQNAVATTMTDYPNNELEDRFVLLRAMIVGQTQSIKNYKDSLQAFVKRYERTSKLVPYAKSLIEGSDKIFKTDSVRLSKNKLVYDLDLNYPHYLCFVVSDKEVVKPMIEKYNAYNTEYYTDQKLKVESFNLDSAHILITVKSFPNDIQVLNYYEKQKGKSAPVKQFPGNESIEIFAITSKNYKILTEAHSYESYLEFFRRNYLKK